MSYKFIHTQADGTVITYELAGEERSWPEMIDEFTCFLRGCGFMIGELEAEEKEDE